MTLKLCNYLPLERPDGPYAPRPGIVHDDIIIDAEKLLKASGRDCACGGTLLALLGCRCCKEVLRAALARETGGVDEAARLSSAQVRLCAPVPAPGALLCVAGNYEEHIRESKAKNLTGQVHASDRATPRVFMKPSTNTVQGAGDPVVISRNSQFVDYEGELLAIIGTGGRYIEEENALSHVAGVTCFNDISERRLQIWERPETRPWDRFFDWLNGKWGDGYAPMGPCAVPVEDIEDIQNLRLQTFLNGETVQDSNTGCMIFSVAQLVSWVSQFMTLSPGDVIATGTPSGVGIAREVAMQPGDIVEVEIEGIGRLVNPVIREE